MAFTEREWKAKQSIWWDGKEGEYFISIGGQYPIARIDCHHNEQEANAHLIAAAPELYVALKEIEANIYWGNTQEAAERHDRTLKALAKAEGK